MALSKKTQEVQALIYKVFDTLDPTGTNSEYYRGIFDKMDDKEFYKFCQRDLCFRFHSRPFEISPDLPRCEAALDVLGVPLLEKVAMPYLYKDQKGNPVWSKPAMVIYVHIKKMKQFLVKKNNLATSIDSRDMKTGLLLGHDKGGKSSDRQMEAMTVVGLDATMKEISTWRADFMDAKSVGYQTILTTGTVSDKDIPISSYDSASKNMLNAYMVCSFINTNVLNVDYMLPKTLRARQQRVARETE